jgi:flagellar motility protein MotE (MotC chaperone)
MDKMELFPHKSPAVFFFLIATFFFTPPSYAQETSPAMKNQAPSFSSVEERRIFTKMQEARKNANSEKKDLSLREKELKTLNEAVDKKLEEINRKLQELQTLQDNLKTLLAQKSAEEIKKVKELSKIYEKMSPDKAALALSKMDDKLVTDILANMKAKSAAKILDALDRKKASEISTTFSTVK